MAIRSEAYKTWRLSGPIIFGELTQIALGLIDNAMVGAISYNHLAASSLVISVMNIPFVLGIGLTMSVSQTVSMAHGRRDAQKVSHYLFNGFWICTIAAIVIAIGLQLGKNILFHLGQDAAVATLAVPYLQVMGWSTVPMLMFMAVKQFTDGLELTRTAMVLSLLALPLNIFINWLLVYGNWGFPRMELIGAGFGTLITRIVILIALVVIVLLHPLFKRYIAVRKNQWKLNRNTVNELLHIGIPSSLQAGMESGAFAISGIIIGTLGAVQQAAHHIALSCAAFTFMVSMGLAQGGSIRISNAWGRSNWKEITLIGKSTLLSGVCYGILCAVFFVCMRNLLPLAFNTDTTVVALTSTLMLYAAVFQISDATQAIGVGLCRGIKDVRTPTLYVALAYWVLGIPIGCLMAFTFKLGAAGMWIGFVSGLTFSSLLLNKRFFSIIKRNSTGHL
ncbi:multidrug resistance protein, MATE family [Filimonas lacunae]|uniref:Multidrug-efflux transporter n=1 Tax=Filimonas lacunae TaxID=477680 RepID=A0A1N7LCL3_9BACT|nr:MATE family efflux transporter [Filimonas lacunae]SIS71556.1 multidrug resistance protein, MATE family [Filimonas lacunae]